MLGLGGVLSSISSGVIFFSGIYIFILSYRDMIHLREQMHNEVWAV
jgi:hypothetical protein